MLSTPLNFHHDEGKIYWKRHDVIFFFTVGCIPDQQFCYFRCQNALIKTIYSDIRVVVFPFVVVLKLSPWR